MIRIVKMTFRPEALEEFKTLFRSVQPQIAAFEGCEKVDLWQEINEPTVMMTCSHWISPEALENYRQSQLFKTTWEKTKALFAGKPEAWSMETVNE